MKKSILFGCFALVASSLMAQKFEVVWKKYGATAPEWFTDGSEAVDGNNFSGGERGVAFESEDAVIYVSSRPGVDTDDDGALDTSEPRVFMLDALTGEPFSGRTELTTEGIQSVDENYGGGYPLNNVVTTPDGSIYACNMTLASGEEQSGAVKAFRVYHWGWYEDKPKMIIDYQKGSYRLGDKFSVVGDWGTTAYVYACPGNRPFVLRWTFVGGVLASSDPEVIDLEDCTDPGTSVTVAPSITNDDWFYVSGKGYIPTLFTTEGDNYGQMQIDVKNLPKGAVLAGRTTSFKGKNYMAMFSPDQSAFVVETTKDGENITDADIIGFTPVFGEQYVNAYGEGAVDIAVINDELYVYVCAPANGLACYKVNLDATSNELVETDVFQPIVFPTVVEENATIGFTLPSNAQGIVQVKLYDMNGRFAGIISDDATVGYQELSFETGHLRSGNYIARVQCNNQISTARFVVK